MGLYGVLGARFRMLCRRGGVVWEHENTLYSSTMSLALSYVTQAYKLNKSCARI